MPRNLTESQVGNLVESPAWQEIVKQLQQEREVHFSKMVNDLDPRSAGAYQMVELVLGLPNRFITEIRQEDNGNRSKGNVSIFRPKKV